MMAWKRFAVALALLVMMEGCGTPSLLKGLSGRKSFEPKEVSSASAAVKKTGKEAIDIRRDGVTFSDGTFLTRQGISSIRLPEGYYYVNHSSAYVLAADGKGHIALINRKSGKVLYKGELEFPLVSGALRGTTLYFVSQDNRFGVYSFPRKKTLLSAKVGRAYAVDTRIANPITLHNLLVVPTLDGKLLIINPARPNGARGMAIGNDVNLNNIIFLRSLGGRIIAATPKKIISAAPGAMHKYEVPVADVTISGGVIYLLSVDGRVIKLSPSLKVLAEKRFPYAQLTAIGVYGGRVYALDRSGALIVLDKGLSKSKIYDVGEVEDFAFFAGSRLYKDDEVIDLNLLKL